MTGINLSVAATAMRYAQLGEGPGTRPRRRQIGYGAERVAAATCPPRHQHAHAYVTVVLDGAYQQLAYAGRLRAEAGDVLVQPTFDCHLNRPLSSKATLLRLAWPHDITFGGIFRGVPVDDIVRAAQRDVDDAADLLASRVLERQPIAAPTEDWPDLLTADIRVEPRIGILKWAETLGVSREHVSRLFAADYGVPPVRFRLEMRARQAWKGAVRSTEPLSQIAQECGFSDQAHMSRAVHWLTGRPPAAWRAASRQFKTAAAG
jgi:AraC-like DNA-binding protein